MKLNIEIESGSFEKVIKDGIASLTKEEIKDMIKQVFYEAFTKCQDMSNMLITWERPNSWNSTTFATLGPLAKEALQNIDLGPEVEAFKKKMVDALMEHHRDIVEEMMMRLLIEKVAYSDSLRSALEDTVRRVLYEARNNG